MLILHVSLSEISQLWVFSDGIIKIQFPSIHHNSETVRDRIGFLPSFMLHMGCSFTPFRLSDYVKFTLCIGLNTFIHWELDSFSFFSTWHAKWMLLIPCLNWTYHLSSLTKIHFCSLSLMLNSSSEQRFSQLLRWTALVESSKFLSLVLERINFGTQEKNIGKSFA